MRSYWEKFTIVCQLQLGLKSTRGGEMCIPPIGMLHGKGCVPPEWKDTHEGYIYPNGTFSNEKRKQE